MPRRPELPRHGGLEGAYFIPRAEDMFWTAVMMASHYDLALTFGKVSGEFLYDHTMPKVGSLKAKRYQAIAILRPAPPAPI
jgi:hypothetical protein